MSIVLQRKQTARYTLHTHTVLIDFLLCLRSKVITISTRLASTEYSSPAILPIFFTQTLFSLAFISRLISFARPIYINRHRQCVPVCVQVTHRPACVGRARQCQVDSVDIVWHEAISKLLEQIVNSSKRSITCRRGIAVRDR